MCWEHYSLVRTLEWSCQLSNQQLGYVSRATKIIAFTGKEVGTCMAARRAKRAFSSRIRFLSSSFLCCCSRRLSSPVLSSHSYKGEDTESVSSTAREREREKTSILHGRMGTDYTFLLLARMRLSVVWLACCLLAWCLYQRWIVTAAWFTC